MLETAAFSSFRGLGERFRALMSLWSELLGVLELIAEALGHADTSFCFLSFLSSLAPLDNLAAAASLKIIDYYLSGKI